MGVLHCARNGCSNIMCDRYSYTYGYICNECFEELVSSDKYDTFKGFMNSQKQKEQVVNDIRKRCEDEFPLSESRSFDSEED